MINVWNIIIIQNSIFGIQFKPSLEFSMGRSTSEI